MFYCVCVNISVCVFPSPQGTATLHRDARKRPQANAVPYGERDYLQHSAVQLIKLSDEVVTLSEKLESFPQNVVLFFKVWLGKYFQYAFT